ncbi:hypothetical protein HGA91_05725 [candidate division WWE3 bacterium]|nr:hypothetical protein [candidate division WWE3 bacterium]
MPLHSLRSLSHDRIISLGVTFILLLLFSEVFSYIVSTSSSSLQQFHTSASVFKKQYYQLQTDYEKTLYENQLKQMEQFALIESKLQVEYEYEQFKSQDAQAKLSRIDEITKKYQEVKKTIERNQDVHLDTQSYQQSMSVWGSLMLEQKYDQIEQEIESSKVALEKDYSQYLATLPTPTPSPRPITPTSSAPSKPVEGYSYQLVKTSRGTFNAYVIKLPLSSYSVKTVTANTENCSDNCPAKTLASYVQENNAYAGMNGTYFCPPDYSTCVAKKYSYDFSVFNSSSNTWINQHSLSWNNIGLATFNGSTPQFYRESKNYSLSTVTAGIANFPSLVEQSNVIVDVNQLASYQKDVKGVRGAIGTNGSHVYLALISSATVVDAAYVMQSLGATDALNLDGGGSSALYINGAYKVGPGRLLPNAVVIVRR